MLLTRPANSTWILRDFMRAITAEICGPERVAFSFVINSPCPLTGQGGDNDLLSAEKIIIFRNL